MASPLDLFSKAVRLKRLERELSQRDIADRLHMSMRTIINIEKNRSNPKLETAAILAKELNISLDELVFGQRESSVPKCAVDFFCWHERGRSCKIHQPMQPSLANILWWEKIKHKERRAAIKGHRRSL